MLKILLAICVSMLLTFPAHTQNISVYNFNTFEPNLNKETDSLYLVNFWATWCVPCVKEMPALNSIASKYANTKLKILLVSLDMPGQIDSRLIPFIEKYQVQSEVIVLHDPDFNSWINKVDPSWSGSIPATLFYTKNTRTFYEQSFEYEELDKIVQTKLNEL